MNTSIDYLIMGLLMSGDKSGYDIMKIIELSPVPSISSSCGSIYPAIKRLEKEGMIEKHLIEQDGKPNKKLIFLTLKGKETFMEWLKRPIDSKDFTMIDDIFSQKFLFFSYLNEDDVKSHCNEHIIAANAFIDSIEWFMNQYEQHLDRYALWNLKGSIEVLQSRVRWLKGVLCDLEKGE